MAGSVFEVPSLADERGQGRWACRRGGIIPHSRCTAGTSDRSMLSLPEMWVESWIGSCRWSVIGVTVLSGGLSLAVSRSAQASCLSPERGLLWSYPANGAIDVPVDADLFVNGELYGLPTLADAPLPRIATGVYDLGRLVPQTRYEVRWDGAVIAFTTGDAASPLPREPSSDVLVTRNPFDFTRCPLLLPQGCFDTGQHTSVRFDVGSAVAWLLDVVSCDGTVRQMVWPSGCGGPVVESEDRILCVSARGTGGAGFSETTGVICSAPDVPAGALPRSSACQGAWPPESALTLVADDEVTLGSMSGLKAPSSIEDGSNAEDGSPSADARSWRCRRSALAPVSGDWQPAA
jgi:hypothetical protein